MFQSRKQTSLGNVNLGSLSAPPTFQDMSFLVEQAGRYRGRFVEISWSVPKTGCTFQLTTKYVPNQPLPSWMLYRGVGGSSELVWGHNSNDLTLMHNLVMLECEKGADGGNNISAGTVDNYLASNRNVGAVAAAVSAGTPQNSEAAGGNPASTWLQNLTYGQAPAAPSGSASASAQPSAAAGAGTACGAAPEDGMSSADLLLDGSLTNITVPKLLRYLTNNALTGRLSLQSSVGAAEVFLSSGAVMHAATLEYKGEQAILDASTWTDGEFHFSPDELTGQQTVRLETPDVLASCERMLDFSRYLSQSQVRPNSFLFIAKQLNRAQFEQAVAHAPCQMQQMWRIYENIDGARTLFEVVRCCPMTRPEWIPIVFSLLNAGLIGIADKPAVARPGMFLEGAPFDQEAVNAFMARACAPDGALYKEPFMFFLQQEHWRYERVGTRYALALFSFASSNMLDGNTTPFAPEMMSEALLRILKAKRKLDLVGRLDGQDYALLLPETDSAGAAVFANRIAQLLKKPPIVPAGQDAVLVVSFGIASVPDDVHDLPALVAAVRTAKSRSKMMGAPLCVYGES